MPLWDPSPRALLPRFKVCFDIPLPEGGKLNVCQDATPLEFLGPLLVRALAQRTPAPIALPVFNERPEWSEDITVLATVSHVVEAFDDEELRAESERFLDRAQEILRQRMPEGVDLRRIESPDSRPGNGS